MTSETKEKIIKFAQDASYTYYFSNDDLQAIISDYCDNSELVHTIDDVTLLDLLNDEVYLYDVNNLKSEIWNKFHYTSDEEDEVTDILYSNFSISPDINSILNYTVYCNLILDPNADNKFNLLNIKEFIKSYMQSQLGITKPYENAINMLTKIHEEITRYISGDMTTTIAEDCKLSGYFDNMPAPIVSYFNELYDIIDREAYNYYEQNTFGVTVSMAFGDYLKLKDKIKTNKFVGNITIPAHCAFGSFDSYSGEAGCLEISLKQPFIVDKKFISAIYLDTSQMQIPDENLYTVDSICCMSKICYNYMKLEDTTNGRNI